MPAVVRPPAFELPELTPLLLPPFPPDDEPEELPDEPDEPELEEEDPPPLPPPPPPPPFRFSRECGRGIEANASPNDRIDNDVMSGIAAALTVDVTPSAAMQYDETFMVLCVLK